MEKHDPDDPVAMYIREASNVKPLTKEEETKLFQELGRLDHWGDLDQQREKVARRLIESQLMLVVNIAQRHSASAVPMLELIQEGNIGLMNAVKSFAGGPIGDFAAYAAACIEDTIATAWTNRIAERCERLGEMAKHRRHTHCRAVKATRQTPRVADRSLFANPPAFSARPHRRET